MSVGAEQSSASSHPGCWSISASKTTREPGRKITIMGERFWHLQNAFSSSCDKLGIACSRAPVVPCSGNAGGRGCPSKEKDLLCGVTGKFREVTDRRKKK